MSSNISPSCEAQFEQLLQQEDCGPDGFVYNEHVLDIFAPKRVTDLGCLVACRNCLAGLLRYKKAKAEKVRPNVNNMNPASQNKEIIILGAKRILNCFDLPCRAIVRGFPQKQTFSSLMREHLSYYNKHPGEGVIREALNMYTGNHVANSKAIGQTVKRNDNNPRRLSQLVAYGGEPYDDLSTESQSSDAYADEPVKRSMSRSNKKSVIQYDAQRHAYTPQRPGRRPNRGGSNASTTRSRGTGRKRTAAKRKASNDVIDSLPITDVPTMFPMFGGANSNSDQQASWSMFHSNVKTEDSSKTNSSSHNSATTSSDDLPAAAALLQHCYSGHPILPQAQTTTENIGNISAQDLSILHVLLPASMYSGTDQSALTVSNALGAMTADSLLTNTASNVVSLTSSQSAAAGALLNGFLATAPASTFASAISSQNIWSSFPATLVSSGATSLLPQGSTAGVQVPIPASSAFLAANSLLPSVVTTSTVCNTTSSTEPLEKTNDFNSNVNQMAVTHTSDQRHTTKDQSQSMQANKTHTVTSDNTEQSLLGGNETETKNETAHNESNVSGSSVSVGNASVDQTTSSITLVSDTTQTALKKEPTATTSSTQEQDDIHAPQKKDTHSKESKPSATLSSGPVDSTETQTPATSKRQRVNTNQTPTTKVIIGKNGVPSSMTTISEQDAAFVLSELGGVFTGVAAATQLTTRSEASTTQPTVSISTIAPQSVSATDTIQTKTSTTQMSPMSHVQSTTSISGAASTFLAQNSVSTSSENLSNVETTTTVNATMIPSSASTATVVSTDQKEHETHIPSDTTTTSKENDTKNRNNDTLMDVSSMESNTQTGQTTSAPSAFPSNNSSSDVLSV